VVRRHTFTDTVVFLDAQQLYHRKSKPNRFASKMSEDAIAVVLEPDVAAIFKSSKTVNGLLRSIVSAIRQSSRKKRTETLVS
jgi:hypothetical protein